MKIYNAGQGGAFRLFIADNKTGTMIVDYEKSLIDFANSNPEGFKQVKDDIVVLYPKPTIWNSHCYAAFSENGKF